MGARFAFWCGSRGRSQGMRLACVRCSAFDPLRNRAGASITAAMRKKREGPIDRISLAIEHCALSAFLLQRQRRAGVTCWLSGNDHGTIDARERERERESAHLAA